MSRLWRDATPDVRGRLSMIVGTVHKNWRDSIHYSSVSELERLPRADVHWVSDVKLGGVDFGWQGNGAEVVIVVTLHMLDIVFPLLGNEPQIHMLKGWLRIGGPDGIPEDITDDEIDRNDFRKHLGFLEDKPSQLMWSLVKLYELGTCLDRGFGRFGYDCWGFWRVDEAKGFLFFSEGVAIPTAFMDAPAVIDRQGFASPFRSMCDRGEYSDVKYTPHSARHTIAYERDTRSLTREQRKAWSENMGHGSEVTTEANYGKLSDEHRAEVMESIGKIAGFNNIALTDDEKIALVDGLWSKLQAQPSSLLSVDLVAT